MNVKDGVRLTVTPDKTKALYPQKKERRVNGHLVLREVHTMDDLHDVVPPLQDYTAEVLAARKRRRIFVVVDLEAMGGTGIYITN